MSSEPIVSKTAPSAEFKVSDAGEVEAVFSTFGNVDRDGDVVTREALLPFNGMEVPMVANHDWSLKGWIGMGRISVGTKNAKFTGSFLMDTQEGRDAFQKVRAFKSVSQWSWSFVPKDSAWEDREGKSVRVIKSLAAPPFEVSPVLVGANPETRTLAIKALAETAIEDMVKKAVREVLSERAVPGDEEPLPPPEEKEIEGPREVPVEEPSAPAESDEKTDIAVEPSEGDEAAPAVIDPILWESSQSIARLLAEPPAGMDPVIWQTSQNIERLLAIYPPEEATV